MTARFSKSENLFSRKNIHGYNLGTGGCNSHIFESIYDGIYIVMSDVNIQQIPPAKVGLVALGLTHGPRTADGFPS